MAKQTDWRMSPKMFLKKTAGVGLLLAVCLLALGCSSTATAIATGPVLYTDNPTKTFTILGEVTYESTDKIGYIDLLQAAKAKYPNCDYVIDIMIDSKTTTQVTTKTFGSSKTGESTLTYAMRGTAIQYSTSSSTSD